jgi:hypothetical protein
MIKIIPKFFSLSYSHYALGWEMHQKSDSLYTSSSVMLVLSNLDLGVLLINAFHSDQYNDCHEC